MIKVVTSMNEVRRNVFYCRIGAFIMADKPFRVLLDLTELHIECLKYVWMNVPPQELKTIADFKGSVIRKINLHEKDIKLFVRNGLLLDDETVMILREDDTVKVLYVDDQSGCSHTENHFKESKRSSRKRIRSENLSDLSIAAKKCKGSNKTLTQENEALQYIEIYRKKKKKHKQPSQSSENLYESKTYEVKDCNKDFHNNEKETILEKNKTDFNSLWKSDSFVSFDNEDSSLKKDNEKLNNQNVDAVSGLKLNSAKDLLPANVSPKPENVLTKSFDINTKTIKLSEGLNNNCPKKKRKRRKKRKQGLQPVVDVINNTEIKEEFKSFTNEVEKSIQRKHITYSSSPYKKEDVSLDQGSKNEDVVDLMIDTFDFAEDVSNMDVKQNNYPKISTPAQSDFCKNPKWCSSLMQQADLNFHQNETMGFKVGKYRNCSHKKYTDENGISFDNPKNNETFPESGYANLPSLNSRPDIGAHIAYKILELDEHYSPVISGYREGIVKSINLDNEEMEIELLKHEIKPGRTGKFENLKIDEVPLPEIKTSDVVRWSSLVEPKIIAC